DQPERRFTPADCENQDGQRRWTRHKPTRKSERNKLPESQTPVRRQLVRMTVMVMMAGMTMAVQQAVTVGLMIVVFHRLELPGDRLPVLLPLPPACPEQPQSHREHQRSADHLQPVLHLRQRQRRPE